MPVRKNLILDHAFGLGDTIMMTALVRDIHRAFPKQYKISVRTNFSTVWADNPNVQFLKRHAGKAQIVRLRYKDGIGAAGKGRKIHHLAWYHEDFKKKTGLRVPVTEAKPDLYLSQESKKPLIKGRYWVAVAGGKRDMTIKHWDYAKFQEVVDTLKCLGIHCVQVGATHKGHVHPALKNVLSLVGKTEDIRDLFNVIRYADGVICPVTAAMHIAAAFDKPCVVISGGREEWWWAGYTNVCQNFGPEASGKLKVPHRFLHTQGLIHCCDVKGCWKKRVVAIEPSDFEPQGKRKLCAEPVRKDSGQAVALCMDMIHPNHVVNAAMSYYEDGTIPPIGEPLEVPGPPAGPEKKISLFSFDDVQEEKPPEDPPVLQREPKAETGIKAANLAPYTEMQPKDYHEKRNSSNIFDHPYIGGKFTIFVLCYGNYPQLAKRCLDGIIKTTPADRLDLRVGANQVCKETLDYLKSLPLTKLYHYPENRLKYPVMRDMFWDRDCPIDSKYIVWFDDDSYTVKPNWQQQLAEAIVANHKKSYRLYGIKFFHDLKIYMKRGHRPELWFKEADWYKGVMMRDKRGRGIPNGSVVHFVAGGFFALGTDAIRFGDIPDRRLEHNGGDITIGEQVHQAGFKVCDFNRGKEYVFSSGHKRRGFHQNFPWSK